MMSAILTQSPFDHQKTAQESAGSSHFLAPSLPGIRQLITRFLRRQPKKSEYHQTPCFTSMDF
jgi:hypothetical protein